MKMKRFFLAGFLFSISIGLFAQQQATIELWPSLVPGETKAKQPLAMDAKNDEGILRVTEVTNPTLKVYHPIGKKKGIGVVVCPGGGYSILAYDLEGSEVARWLAKQGFTAFVLAYRVPNKMAGALQDVQRAIRVVRQQYTTLEKVGVIGFSAGASLSARVSTRFKDSLYSAVDAADKQSGRPDFALLIYPAYLDQGKDNQLTPELTLSPQTPPMFIFSTADDDFGNSALVMAQALRKNKTRVELHFMPEGGHGYGLRKGAGLQWPPLAEKWLKWILKK